MVDCVLLISRNRLFLVFFRALRFTIRHLFRPQIHELSGGGNENGLEIMIIVNG